MRCLFCGRTPAQLNDGDVFVAKDPSDLNGQGICEDCCNVCKANIRAKKKGVRKNEGIYTNVYKGE